MIFFWLALFAAAGIYVLVQNIGIVILSFFVIYIVFSIVSFLFTQWPGRTMIAIVVIIVAVIIGFNIFSTSKINNTPVTIYRAADTCVIYDEDHELVQVPKGAIVARYTDPEVKSKEVSVAGNSDRCVWYYDGQISTSTVSTWHEMDLEEFDYEPNIWNLVEIKEITYKEFQKNNWWAN